MELRRRVTWLRYFDAKRKAWEQTVVLQGRLRELEKSTTRWDKGVSKPSTVRVRVISLDEVELARNNRAEATVAVMSHQLLGRVLVRRCREWPSAFEKDRNERLGRAYISGRIAPGSEFDAPVVCVQPGLTILGLGNVFTVSNE